MDYCDAADHQYLHNRVSYDALRRIGDLPIEHLLIAD